MSTRPISHFGQVLNSVKKQPSSATPNHRQRSTPTNWPLQGKLIFKKPDLPRLPSSPIVIDDESMPVQETADSWERDEFFLSDHGARDPYDETYRPIQQDLVEDSEDETMEHTMRKTRHQPQRMASTRKPEARDQAILSPTAMGMWTPPDSNTRARRTGERVNGGGGTSTKGKEKAQTPATSDPVNIPVLGDPTTKSSSSVTPLGRTRTEMYVALSPLTENTSAARHSRTTSLAASTSGKGSREGAEQVRPWLSKRTAETKPTQKRSVQTKMTTFVSEGSSVPFSSTHHLNTTRGGHGDVHMVSAPSHDFMDDDVFEQQSVCFVKRKINAPADEMSTSARSKQHAPSGIPKPARPLPQRKKRKSGELSTSSDEAIQAEVQTTSSDTVGQSREDLTSRLKAHKRFKFQNHQQENARKLLSDDRMDATSSLTSLSKEPSSEVDDVAGQEVVKSGLKVVKGRPGRAMNVLYSSDVEQDLPVQEDAVAAGVHEEELPFQQTLSTTQSSIVPDSQPWYHMLLPDLNKSHGIDKEPQEQNDRSSNMILRKDQTTAQEPLSNTQPEDHAIPGPSVPVTLERQEAYDTGDGRSTNGMGSFRRPLMQEESRTFPFDFSLQSHLAVVDGTPTESSGGSISSLSQPTHKTPDKGTKIQLREKYFVCLFSNIVQAGKEFHLVKVGGTGT
ncbi:hypothetical protein QFC19_002939 [Naganishia cerealis]|uniref:Uncharacterized protein n=1 Tax=Naganishia cerealis TaxID=610337 RepID=A0ACC2W798_9TREE|nr:hypothetical protein QFC19_002939 [Naganishia cerealis]